MRHRDRFLVISALLLAHGFGVAALAAARQPALQTPARTVESDIATVGIPYCRTYTDKDGLPQNTIQTIATDSKGYLWVGTQDGAACYNGRKWELVRMPTASSGSHIINFIFTTSDGMVWFGPDGGGLHQLNLADNTWKNFDQHSGLPDGVITTLREITLPNGPKTLVAGTRNGRLVRYESGHWVAFQSPPDLSNDMIQYLYETTSPNGNHTLWVGTRKNKLLRFESGIWTTFEVLAEAGVGITNLMQADDDNGRPTLWVVANGKVFRFDNGRFEQFQLPSELASSAAYCLLGTTDHAGKPVLWIGTNSGLIRHQAGGWRVLNTRSGLPHNFIFTLVETTGGVSSGKTVWIGTLGGLTRLEENQWLTVDTRSGLTNHFVLSLLETTAKSGKKAFWIGTFGGDTGGVWKFEDGQWTNFDTRSGLPNNVVWCLMETKAPDGQSIVWIGTNGGVTRFQNGSWKTFDTGSGLGSNSVMCLYETKDQNGHSIIWAGTANGLSRLEAVHSPLSAVRSQQPAEASEKETTTQNSKLKTNNSAEGRWTTLTTQSGLVGNSISQVLETKSDSGKSRLWVATSNGVSRLEDGHWTAFSTQNGLPDNRILSLRETGTETGRRFLWVGSHGGVSCLDMTTGDWMTLSDATTPALPNNTVYQIREDSQKRIYLSTNKGIVRLTPTNAAQSGYQAFTFSREDGLPSNECNRGASLVDSQGRLWFGTIAGAVMFDPSQEVLDRTAKHLYIEKTRLQEKEISLTPNHPLAYHENNLSFEYALLSFFRETETRFQTQLVGLEKTPSAWTTDFKREYLNLEDGDYVFQVWGKDYAGNITGPVAVAFRIRPAPWKTWWAYLLYLVALSVATYGFIQHRLRVLQRYNRELEAKVAERTAQVVAQKDELAQANLKLKEVDQIKANFTAMLVHDLKSPLSVVKATLELFDVDETIRTSSMGSLVTASERSVDKILNLINEVLEVFRSESQAITLKKSFLDTESLLRECSEEARLAARASQVSVFFNIRPELPSISADQEKLGRVLSNLFSNAIKFTPPGGSITLDAQTTEGQGVEEGLTWLRISITDTGEGISPEELPYVFDPYQQAQSNKARLGVGLGLAIVKRIVAAHGGNISVRSQVGVGSSFTMMLPVTTSSDKLQKFEVEV